MIKKRLAWLLAAAMLVTSINPGTLYVQAAEAGIEEEVPEASVGTDINNDVIAEEGAGIVAEEEEETEAETKENETETEGILVEDEEETVAETESIEEIAETESEAEDVKATAKAETTELVLNTEMYANIDTEGQYVDFSFTPQESGTYYLYSTAEADTRAWLYNANDMENYIDSDDGGEGNNFRLSHELEAQQTYIYRVQYYSEDNTGTIPVMLRQKMAVQAVDIVDRSDNYLAGIENSNPLGEWDVQLTYTDGTTEILHPQGAGSSQDDYLSISNLESANGDTYDYNGVIPAGTYTVTIGCNDISAEEQRVTFLDKEDYEFDELQEGDVISGASGAYHFYKFTATESGYYQLAYSQGDTCAIYGYDALNGMYASVMPTNGQDVYNLEKDKVYIIGTQENHSGSSDYKMTVKKILTMTAGEKTVLTSAGVGNMTIYAFQSEEGGVYKIDRNYADVSAYDSNGEYAPSEKLLKAKAGEIYFVCAYPYNSEEESYVMFTETLELESIELLPGTTTYLANIALDADSFFRDWQVRLNYVGGVNETFKLMGGQSIYGYGISLNSEIGSQGEDFFSYASAVPAGDYSLTVSCGDQTATQTLSYKNASDFAMEELQDDVLVSVPAEYNYTYAYYKFTPENTGYYQVARSDSFYDKCVLDAETMQELTSLGNNYEYNSVVDIYQLQAGKTYCILLQHQGSVEEGISIQRNLLVSMAKPITADETFLVQNTGAYSQLLSFTAEQAANYRMNSELNGYVSCYDTTGQQASMYPLCTEAGKTYLFLVHFYDGASESNMKLEKLPEVQSLEIVPGTDTFLSDVKNSCSFSDWNIRVGYTNGTTDDVRPGSYESTTYQQVTLSALRAVDEKEYASSAAIPAGDYTVKAICGSVESSTATVHFISKSDMIKENLAMDTVNAIPNADMYTYYKFTSAEAGFYQTDCRKYAKTKVYDFATDKEVTRARYYTKGKVRSDLYALEANHEYYIRFQGSTSYGDESYSFAISRGSTLSLNTETNINKSAYGNIRLVTFTSDKDAYYTTDAKDCTISNIETSMQGVFGINTVKVLKDTVCYYVVKLSNAVPTGSMTVTETPVIKDIQVQPNPDRFVANIWQAGRFDAWNVIISYKGDVPNETVKVGKKDTYGYYVTASSIYDAEDNWYGSSGELPKGSYKVKISVGDITKEVDITSVALKDFCADSMNADTEYNVTAGQGLFRTFTPSESGFYQEQVNALDLDAEWEYSLNVVDDNDNTVYAILYNTSYYLEAGKTYYVGLTVSQTDAVFCLKRAQKLSIDQTTYIDRSSYYEFCPEEGKSYYFDRIYGNCYISTIEPQDGNSVSLSDVEAGKLYMVYIDKDSGSTGAFAIRTMPKQTSYKMTKEPSESELYFPVDYTRFLKPSLEAELTYDNGLTTKVSTYNNWNTNSNQYGNYLTYSTQNYGPNMAAGDTADFIVYPSTGTETDGITYKIHAETLETMISLGYVTELKEGNQEIVASDGRVDTYYIKGDANTNYSINVMNGSGMYYMWYASGEGYDYEWISEGDNYRVTTDDKGYAVLQFYSENGMEISVEKNTAEKSLIPVGGTILTTPTTMAYTNYPDSMSSLEEDELLVEGLKLEMKYSDDSTAVIMPNTLDEDSEFKDQYKNWYRVNLYDKNDNQVYLNECCAGTYTAKVEYNGTVFVTWDITIEDFDANKIAQATDSNEIPTGTDRFIGTYTAKEDGKYRFDFNVAVYMSVADSENKQVEVINVDSENHYYLILKAGQKYIIGAVARESDYIGSWSMGVVKAPDVTEIAFTMAKENYLAGVESPGASDYQVKLTYSDGKTGMVTGNDIDAYGNRFVYEVSDESGTKVNLADGLKVAKYSAKASIATGTCVSSTAFYGMGSNVSKLETITENVEKMVDFDDAVQKQYLFTPSVTGYYETNTDDIALHFYLKNEQDAYELVSGELTGGTQYLVDVVCGGWDSSVGVTITKSDSSSNQGELPTKPLTLGKMETVVITKSGGSAAYTFTATETGFYQIRGGKGYSSNVYLYQNESYIDDTWTDDCKEGVINAILKQGTEYKIVIDLEYGTCDDYTLLVDKIEKKTVKSMAIIAPENENWSEPVYLGDLTQNYGVKIIYTDGTESSIEKLLQYNYVYDAYGNAFNTSIARRYGQDEEDANVYRLNCSLESNSSMQAYKEISVKKNEEAEEKTLTLGQTETATLPAYGSAYWKFIPETTGYYFLTQEGNVSTNIQDRYYDDVNWNNGSYKLSADNTYFIYIYNYGSAATPFSLTIQKTKTVTGLKLTKESTQKECLKYQDITFAGMEVEISYADGTTKQWDTKEGRNWYNGEDGFGNDINYLAEKLNDSEYQIGFSCGNYTAYQKTRVKSYNAFGEGTVDKVLSVGDNAVTCAKGTAGASFSFTPSAKGTYVFTLPDGTDTYAYLWRSNATCAYHLMRGMSRTFSVELVQGEIYYLYYYYAESDTDATGTIKIVASNLSEPCTQHKKAEGDEGKIVKPATCTTDAEAGFTCVNCGQTFTETVAGSKLGHDYIWITDKEATCAEEGSKHEECSRCHEETGETKVIPVTDEHGELVEVTTKVSTCAEEGSAYKECTICHRPVGEAYKLPLSEKHGEEIQVIDKVPTCVATGTAHKQCTVCGKTIGVSYELAIDPNAHSYGEWVVTKVPTKEEKGSQTRTCTLCGHEDTEEIPSLCNHEKAADDQGTLKTAATCTKNEVRTYTCTICKESFDEEAADTMTPHSYEWKIDKPATCGVAGSRHEECTVCHDQKTAEVIPATGNHTFNTGEVIKPATCTANELRKYTCVSCGATEEKEVPNSTLDHEYEWIIDLEATCGDAGSKHQECKNCHGKEAAVEIPATGEHQWDAGTVTAEATCTEDEQKEYTCTVCHHTKTEGTPDTALGHEMEWVTDQEATCEADGSRHKECTRCHETGETESIPAIGHAYGAWKTTKRATALAAGEMTRTCANCGDEEKKPIAKLAATLKVSKTSLNVPFATKGYLTVSGMATGDGVASWKSSNTSVATVTGGTGTKATIYAKKLGTTVITVTLKSKKTQRIAIKVTPVATKTMKLSKTKATLKVKKSLTLKVTRTPVNVTDKVTFKTSNKKVAIVSATGKITAKKKGKATITVTSGSKKATCKITVK